MSASAEAQHPCSPAPATYSYNNGQLTVIEGPVTPAVVEPANYPPCDQSPGTLKPGAADLAQGWKRGQHASVAITTSGGTDGARFIVVWDTDTTADPLGSNNNYRSILSARFDATGHCVPWPAPNQNYGIRELSQNTGDTWSNNFEPTVAMSADATFQVAWVGHRLQAQLQNEVGPGSQETLLTLGPLSLHSDPSGWPHLLPPFPGSGKGDVFASVATDDAHRRPITWTSHGKNGATRGVDYSVDTVNSPPTTTFQLETSTNQVIDKRVAQWGPAISARADGYQAECWTSVESACQNFYDDTPCSDIHMQLFDPSGNKIGVELTANERQNEFSNSIQNSPAVSFVGSDIVVTWQGFILPSYTGPNTYNIYAKRFTWTGGTGAPVAVGSMFAVNTDLTAHPLTTGYDNVGNASVALSETGNGRYIITWNVQPNTPTGQPTPGSGIRAQFFQGSQRLGQEFRLNQDTTQQGYTHPCMTSTSQTIFQRRLGRSAGHALRYGSIGVVCTWTAFDEDIQFSPNPPQMLGIYNNNRVFFTVLPPGFDDFLSTTPCCKGDMNYDGVVNGLDIQFFINVLLGGSGDAQHTDGQNFCRADMNGDGILDTQFDIPFFAQSLLATTVCPGPDYTTHPYDFDNNGIPDPQDIAADPHKDCNHNGILDAADLVLGQALLGGAPDCNNNSIPDSCDVDPTDPDGNGLVSPDCNHNGIPDSCDIANGPPTFDCNNNGIPDSCDIASGFSQDCTHNGIPDSCDIASGHYRDLNHNGIPDICDIAGDGPNMPIFVGGGEGEGGGAGESQCAPFPDDPDAAWAEANAWAAQQTWGPASGLTGDEQYQLWIDKLCELGLIELGE